MPALVNWQSPACIAAGVQRPVKEVWAVIEALGVKPEAFINETPHYGREAVEAIETAFDDVEGDDHE